MALAHARWTENSQTVAQRSSHCMPSANVVTCALDMLGTAE